jgi:Gpi18-like mannosyltransferase
MLADFSFILPCHMKDLVKTRLELLLLFVVLVVLLPTRGMWIDFEYWTNWAVKIHRHGLVNVYDDGTTDYHPIFLYVLYIYGLLQGSEELIVSNINNIKIFGLLFDFLPIVVLCAFRKKLINTSIPHLFLLLNVAYLFNSLIWGQIDSVHTNLSFLALLFGFTNPILSAFLFAVALGTKLQAIIYLPVLAIIWLYSIKNTRALVLLLVTILLTLFVICLPFIMAGKLPQLWHVVTGAMGRYPYVSICAFNLWYIISTGDLGTRPDTSIYFIFSYKQIGLFLFMLFSAATLLPFLFRMLRLKLAKHIVDSNTQKMLMLAAGLVAFYFFYFNTQMHERYASPIVIFFFFYAVFSKNYILYILASISYFLTLDKCFPDYLPIIHYKIIYASKVIAIWYTITISYAVYLFFKEFSIKEEYRLLRDQWTQA